MRFMSVRVIKSSSTTNTRSGESYTNDLGDVVEEDIDAVSDLELEGLEPMLGAKIGGLGNST